MSLVSRSCGWIKTGEEKAIQKAKDLCGITISKSMATHIVGLAKQNDGGNLDLAIRSKDVRALRPLYAMSTGQSVTDRRPTRLGLSGLEVLESFARPLPFKAVLLTGTRIEADCRRAEQAGALACFKKLFELDLYESMLADIAGRLLNSSEIARLVFSIRPYT